MKLERLLEIGNDKFRVKFSGLGSEEYYLNDELIEKRWSFSFKGKRAFQINGNELVIDVSVFPGNYYCKAFLNGNVFIEELFPELQRKVKNGGFIPSPIKNVIVWFVLSAVFLVIIEFFKGSP